MAGINEPPWSDWRPTDEQKCRLREFVGYGRWSAPLVFVGYEEKCSEFLDEQKRNIYIRCHHPGFQVRVADKNKVHGGADGLDATALRPGGKVKVWNTAARFRVALGGTRVDQDDKVFKRRFAEEYCRLGTLGGDTLLTERLPLPRPRHGAFRGTYLSEWFGEYGGYTRYLRQEGPGRLDVLRGLFAGSGAPAYVICYGKFFQRERGAGLFDLQRAFEMIELPSGGMACVGLTQRGTAVALTEFFGTRGAGGVHIADIQPIVDRLVDLKGGQPL